MVKNLYPLVFFILFFNLKCFGQMVSPKIINNGGGFSSNLNYSLEWSIGEAELIKTFNSNLYFLNSGLLQGVLIKKGFFSNDAINVTIAPNPIKDFINLKINFNSLGEVDILLFDLIGKIKLKNHFLLTEMKLNKLLETSSIPNGVYFLQINFKPLIGESVTNNFKILKVSE